MRFLACLVRAGAFVALASFPVSQDLPAQDQAYAARTVQLEPELVSIDKLRVQMKPLTKAEVEVELAAWLAALAAQARTVRDLTVQAMEETDSTRKAGFSEQNVVASARRDDVADRVNVVADSFEAKGGEPADARKYVDSVAGLPPVTGIEEMALNAKSWLLSKDGGLRLLLNIGQFLLVLVAFRVLAAVIAGLLDRGLGRLRKTSDLLRSFLVNTLRKVLFFIGLVIALSYIGVNIGPFIAAIGAAGFVIGFALQGTLSNFAAGIMILIYRPYDIGDVVTAAGVTGKVESMNLVSTAILTPDNQTIVVPNNSIWGGVITNITAKPTRRVDLTFGIGYGDDIGKAKQILLDLCAAHPLVMADPVPVVEVGALADSAVNLICRPWARTSDYWTVFWDLTRQVKERFDAEGIAIPFPQRDVHVYQHAAS